uniref:Glycoside hydrolase family 13 protein n=1 Tax=termite gut metagenome TaxID=433724 RepID=S0DGA7_9ZZZZ
MSATTSFPYTPTIPAGYEGAKFPDWLNSVVNYHNRGDGATGAEDEEITTYADFNGLDDLFTEDPAVVQGLIDIYTAWMEWGVAGFRIDTVKHVDFDFWKTFTAAVKAYQESGAAGIDPDFFEFGEVYSGAVTDTAPYVRDTGMNATLDFPFAFSAQEYLKGADGSVIQGLFEADDYYTTAQSDARDQVTFLDNHDMGRLPYLLTTSTFGAGVSDNLPQRTALGNDLEFLSRGQPVVYYGDEQGFDGDGNDWHSRQTMCSSPAFAGQALADGSPIGNAWSDADGCAFSTSVAGYTQIAALAALRETYPALKTGTQISLANRYAAYAFARVDPTAKQEALVAINSGTLPVTDWMFTALTANATYTVLYSSGTGGVAVGDTIISDASGQVTLTVPALGAVVLEPDATVTAPVAPATDGPGGSFTVTPGIDLNGSGTDTLVAGLAPITASAPAGAWSQTTFSVRVVGTDDWVVLGTDTGPDPRIFDDTSQYAAGTLLEYRAVNVDAAGNTVAASTLAAVDAPARAPESDLTGWVTLPGTFGHLAGCDDWDPACSGVKLELNPVSGLYTTTLALPAGAYDYKVALNGAWDVNYGVNSNGVPGTASGDDRIFTVPSAQNVTFWYDPETHYFTESVSGVYTVAGLGNVLPGAPCGQWDASCMAALMVEDPAQTGQYIFTTSQLPAGTYSAKAVLNGSDWKDVTGQCGPDGAVIDGNCQFTVAAGQTVTVIYDTKGNGGSGYTSIVTPALTTRSVDKLQAYWIDDTTLAWPTATAPTATAWSFVYSAIGGIGANGSAIVNGATIPLTQTALLPSQTSTDGYKFLASGYVGLKLPSPLPDGATIESLLTGETVVAAYAPGRTLLNLTGTQNQMIIDATYSATARAAAADAPLGVTVDGSDVTLRLWAPTAKLAAACIYDSADPATSDTCTEQTTVYDPATGVWTATGGWKNLAYDWHVTTYALDYGVNASGTVDTNDWGVRTNTVVDPYATGLTVNSAHAVAVDPADYAPGTAQPDPIRAVDETIYEIHVRDFSVNDQAVDETYRGTYQAFADTGSTAMANLKELAEAGLTTVHILPAFDFASVPEDRTAQTTPTVPDASPDSAEQRDAVCGGLGAFSLPASGGVDGCNSFYTDGTKTAAATDGFNWGYDPLHFMTPEGSYATTGSQAGAGRNAEFTAMVDALHSIGLRVVLDQVYNHTYSSGQLNDNVYDQVVPNYYHRLNQDGRVETSTCCDELAPENAMAEQLVLDAVLMWARDYGIDGFRYDLMGFMPRSTMVKIVDELAAYAEEQGRTGLCPDGATTCTAEARDPVYYQYGEGWNFGSISNNRLFVTAIQGQLNGTGVGTFSDGLRDASLGSQTLNATGFTTGSADACNNAEIAQGLAGNLYAYTGANAAGCASHSVGYASSPAETISYVDAHDNQTLYDMLAMRLPDTTSMTDRVRYNTLALATVTFAQTPVFWHGGTDLLRSKSLDPNSYNSGDHFNYIDWTGAISAFGTGLPPTTNRDNTDWESLMTSLLGNAALIPGQVDAEAAHDMAMELLELRSSTPLFRLGTTDLINDRVSFPVVASGNTAVLAMLVEDPSPSASTTSLPGFDPSQLVKSLIEPSGTADIDPEHDAMLVVYNTSAETRTETLAGLAGRNFTLNDIQAGTATGVPVTGADDVVEGTVWDSTTGTITIPALTAAVLFDEAGTVVLTGDFQQRVGCGTDWNTTCEQTTMTQSPTDPDLYTLTLTLFAGDYEFKPTVNGAYPNGNNLNLSLAVDATVTFTFHMNDWTIDADTTPVAGVWSDATSQLTNPDGSTCQGKNIDCLPARLTTADNGQTYTGSIGLDQGEYSYEIYMIGQTTVSRCAGMQVRTDRTDTCDWTNQTIIGATPQDVPSDDPISHDGDVNVRADTSDDRVPSYVYLPGDGIATFTVRQVTGNSGQTLYTYSVSPGVYTVTGSFQDDFTTLPTGALPLPDGTAAVTCAESDGVTPPTSSNWQPACLNILLQKNGGLWVWGSSDVPAGNQLFKISGDLSFYEVWGQQNGTATPSTTPGSDMAFTQVDSQYVEILFNDGTGDDTTYATRVNGYLASDNGDTGPKLADGTQSYTLTVSARELANSDPAVTDPMALPATTSDPVTQTAFTADRIMIDASAAPAGVTVGAWTRNADGTYSATVTSTVPGTFNLPISVTGLPSNTGPVLLNTAELKFSGILTAAVTTTSDDAVADGTATDTIRVSVTDQNNAPVTGRAVTVTLPTGVALASGQTGVTDNHDGTATVTTGVDGTVSLGLTSTTPGDYTVSAVPVVATTETALAAVAGDNATNPATFVAVPTLTVATTAQFAGEPPTGAVGDTLTYTITVTNNGSVPVSGVTISNAVTLTDLTYTWPTGSNPAATATTASGTLGAGESVTLTGTYTLTPDDIAAHQATNQATACRTSPAPLTVDGNCTTGSLVATGLPGLSISQQASPETVTLNGDPTSLTTADKTVTYTYTVTNTGQTPLTGVAVVKSATTFTGSGALPVVTCAPTVLGLGETATCTATYVLSQDDIDQGSVAGQANATASFPAPASGNAAAVGTVSSGLSNQATVTIEANATLSLNLAGQVTITSDDGYPLVGDAVAWTLTVTNTGNTTQRNLSFAGAVLPGRDVSLPSDCNRVSLAPGASYSCTVTGDVVTPADLAAGKIDLAAVVAATNDPADLLDDVTAPDDITVNLAQRTPITVAAVDASKVYGDADPSFTLSGLPDGWVAGIHYTVSWSREPGEDVETYTVTGTVTLLSGHQFADGGTTGIVTTTLAITPKPLTIMVGSGMVSWTGAPVTGILPVSATGLVGDDQLATATTTVSGTAAGPYPSALASGDVRIADATGDVTGNYTILVVQGTLTITPLEAAVTVETDPAQADGTDTQPVTIAVTRADGSVVTGAAVTLDVSDLPEDAVLTSTDGTILKPDINGLIALMTDEDGQVTVTVTSATAGDFTIPVAVAGVEKMEPFTVSFVAVVPPTPSQTPAEPTPSPTGSDSPTNSPSSPETPIEPTPTPTPTVSQTPPASPTASTSGTPTQSAEPTAAPPSPGVTAPTGGTADPASSASLVLGSLVIVGAALFLMTIRRRESGYLPKHEA